jgi:hypothetical protein
MPDYTDTDRYDGTEWDPNAPSYNDARPVTMTPLPASSGTTRDTALGQYRDYLSSVGGTWNAETENDFNNIWRQSAENSVYAGQGLDNANPFAANFEAFKPRLAMRWQEEQGQDRYDDTGRDYWPGGVRPEGAQGSATRSTTGQRSASSSYPAFDNSSPTFDDPSSRLLEDYALDRFRMRQNPDPNSGTALFEKYARELIDTLKQPVYSAGDEATIKAGAIDSIMRERDATKQRWLEEVGRRGISPSSGPALDGLRKIDEHYGQLKTTVDAEFAREAIGQTRNQRFQTMDVLGQLAGSEEGRLREAMTYATVPYELENNAFQRNLQLVGAGGNPASLFNSALQLAQYGQQADQANSQGRAALSTGLMQLLGYYFGNNR